jgi:hypothetical protein
MGEKGIARYNHLPGRHKLVEKIIIIYQNVKKGIKKKRIRKLQDVFLSGQKHSSRRSGTC